jgi:hypothetical protein
VAELRSLSIDAKGYAYQIQAVISLLRMGLSRDQVAVSLNPEPTRLSRAVRPKTYLDLGRMLLRLRFSPAPRRPAPVVWEIVEPRGAAAWTEASERRTAEFGPV